VVRDITVLQFGRVPIFRHNLDRLIVADMSDRKVECDPRDLTETTSMVFVPRDSTLHPAGLWSPGRRTALADRIFRAEPCCSDRQKLGFRTKSLIKTTYAAYFYHSAYSEITDHIDGCSRPRASGPSPVSNPNSSS